MKIKIHKQSGWINNVQRVLSPNFNQRPLAVSAIVIHNISLPPGEFGGVGVQQLFTNQLDAKQHPYYAAIAHLKVSAHLFINRSGDLVQFVSFNNRAWHAGESVLDGQKNCNDFAIGIELEGSDEQEYSALQYQSLTAVSRALLASYPQISRDRIVGHSEIAPGRKTDPGKYFDWQRYLQALD